MLDVHLFYEDALAHFRAELKQLEATRASRDAPIFVRADRMLHRVEHIILDVRLGLVMRALA